nr:DUF4402 domain-containing protein [Pseudomonas sp. Marseille-Q3773]
MNSKSPTLTAQQARDVYIQSRISRRTLANKSIIQANLPALEFPDTLPNDAGNEVNLIPTAMLSDPLKSILPTAWQGGVPAEFKVFVDDDEENPVHSDSYETMPSFPLDFNIPPDRFLTQGIYNVRYRIQTRGALEDSDNTVFTVDRDDPQRNNEPDQLELTTDRINLKYLDDNGGLPFSIPAFSYARPGDYCIIYMKKPGMGEETEVLRTPARPVAGFDPTAPTTGTIPRNQFVDDNNDPLFSDGTVELSYLAMSRAGNQTKRPLVTSVQMAFLPEPSGLQLAVIPLAAEAPALIDRADAILGVTVQAPQFQNHQPTDVVVFKWGNRIFDRVTVGALPSWPIESSVLGYPILIAEGDSAGEGPKDVVVTYSVVRGLLTYDPASSVSTSVNLVIPGPENPDPGPENPALGTVTVRGGGTDPVDNEIRVADKNLPVTVTLPLLSPALPADDVLEVVWNGKPTGATYTVTGGEETEFSITVPYSVVEEHGDNPAMPVQMSLTSGDLDVPPGNVPVTVATNVKVDTFELGALTPPTFPDKVRPPFNSIGCGEKIWEGARFKVEGDAVNFTDKDTVTVHWEGRVSEADDTVIPDTKGSQDFILTAEQAAQGFEHRIPFQDFLDKVADAEGIMVAWYHLTKVSGANAPSEEIFVYPSYTTPSGCKCTDADICSVVAKR